MALFYFLTILIMSNELQIFEKLSWNDKIQYIRWFYQDMIKKTNNPEYIAKFQSKIDEVKWYEKNKVNNSKLVSLYGRIMWAKQQTKQRKIEETKQAIEKQKQKLARIESNSDEQDPDEYLAEAMVKI